MSFSGTFTITKKDNIQYNYFRIQRALVGVAVVTFVALAVLITLVRYSLRVTVASALSSALLIAAAGVVLIVAINMISVVMRVNGLYRQGRMSDFTVQYIVDQTGIHAKSERGDTFFQWQQILLAKETRHAFYLTAEENHTAVIPKAQIKNDGEINALRAIFKKYLPADRVKVAK